jgi:hypothetical protein
MDLETTLGVPVEGSLSEDGLRQRHLHINLLLAATGQPVCEAVDTGHFIATTFDLLASYREKSQLLADYLSPADVRIQTFLDRYLDGAAARLPLASQVLHLHRHGLARELSLPPKTDFHASKYLKSYRVAQGVLHNPLNDRRTTEGSFHIAEGGFPIPGDKKAVPKAVFGAMLKAAMNPPEELLRLPFTHGQEEEAKVFTSLLIRPVVCPAAPGFISEKSMEIRLFAPGSLVSNLDFVESIFGNAGNPYFPSNDAGLDIEHWTGHTGCVILAPHLIDFTKKELGLPHVSEATARQKADGMCWSDEKELYNNGQPFKITARDSAGVIVTLLADNYYGYCKKEVKTQISYAANLYGLVEEEHAGGALTFPRHNHGEEFGADSRFQDTGYTLEQARELLGDTVEWKPEGYGVDKQYPKLIYIPNMARMDLPSQTIAWEQDGQRQTIPLRPDKVYMHPTGYKVFMQKFPGGPSWRLVGTDAEGTFCHKPCTVSGGGKSEISKSIEPAILFGSVFVADLEKDLDMVEEIFNRDYTDRVLPHLRSPGGHTSRPILGPQRSLGSVIKLLTPSRDNTPEFNAWLESIPSRIKSLVFFIKRFDRPEWAETGWRKDFSVDYINGHPGHELKIDDRKLVASNLRVGFETNGAWRVFKLRQDFIPAEKIQMEDDITASILVPSKWLDYLNKPLANPVVKLAQNCEYRFFQRPDDAIHRGLDPQAESDLSKSGNFISNFEPLNQEQIKEIVEDVIGFEQYTQPMKDLLKKSMENGNGFTVSSAHMRLVNGKPSKNPRYLQLRGDMEDGFKNYLADTGLRLYRRIPLEKPLCFPVDAILAGRRNNPPEPGIRPLAVYNPIHYQELPELFMDYICSLTGKSPSTTGAGSEGALTKGPFNALRPVVDLNNTLVGFILSGYGGFSTAAGYIGSHMRVDHDISLLIPEIWSRLSPRMRDPQYLIQDGHLEKIDDFEHEGRTVLASRLGYRITSHFVHSFMGKIFDSPAAALNEAILKPETQDFPSYVDGIDNIVETQKKVAQRYLDDGSIEDACPPIRALLYCMAEGSYEGKDVHHPDIRALFDRDAMLASDWYKQRLATRQAQDVALWHRHCEYLEEFLRRRPDTHWREDLALEARLEQVRRMVLEAGSPEYLELLVGTLGTDPSVALTPDATVEPDIQPAKRAA